MSAPPVAEVLGVSKSYRFGASAVPAVRDVSLSVRSGELVALAGPSGSGKSTLLHLIGCLDRPDRGEIRLGDLRVSHMPAGRLAAVRRERLGFVFQTFNLVPVLTARENVEYPLLLGAVGRAERRARVDELLQRVGLADKHGRRPRELSGGERQRVAIARALVNDPSMLLADEPTGNLDSSTSEEIMRVFENLATTGQTVVMVTHEPDIAAHARRVVVLRDGLLSTDETREAYVARLGHGLPAV
jgi:putative ABC transport system ATP-binding protein